MTRLTSHSLFNYNKPFQMPWVTQTGQLSFPKRYDTRKAFKRLPSVAGWDETVTKQGPVRFFVGFQLRFVDIFKGACVLRKFAVQKQVMVSRQVKKAHQVPNPKLENYVQHMARLNTEHEFSLLDMKRQHIFHSRSNERPRWWGFATTGE